MSFERQSGRKQAQIRRHSYVSASNHEGWARGVKEWARVGLAGAARVKYETWNWLGEIGRRRQLVGVAAKLRPSSAAPTMRSSDSWSRLPSCRRRLRIAQVPIPWLLHKFAAGQRDVCAEPALLLLGRGAGEQVDRFSTALGAKWRSCINKAHQLHLRPAAGMYF